MPLISIIIDSFGKLDLGYLGKHNNNKSNKINAVRAGLSVGAKGHERQL